LKQVETNVEEKVSSREALTIRPARPADAPVLARLMSEAISWGRLGELGQGFVTLVHRHMIDSRYAICFVAEHDGEVLGYSAWGTDTTRFYREFILRHGLRAAVTLLPRAFRPSQLKVIIRGLTYFPESYPDDPRAEILSFAVRPQSKQSGIGKAIFNAMIDDFKTRGINSIKVGTVEETNEAGNRFYRRLGFELIRTIPFYKESRVNVYVYRIA
jgi:ribosomal protein S18 acetylase RimI-like enzyme